MKRLLAVSLILNLILFSVLGCICVKEYTKQYDERYLEAVKYSGRTVYITPTGKRYHLNAECGGENSFESTIAYAVANGLTPCLKCVK